MSEPGTVIAGAGHNRRIDDVKRLKAQYGGEKSDWVKKSSTEYSQSNGKLIQTHWYENINTGERFEFKIKERWKE